MGDLMKVFAHTQRGLFSCPVFSFPNLVATDLDKSEKMGSRFQTARIQYLLGNGLRLSAKDSDASGHHSFALTLMQDMRKDQGAEKLLDRSDLKPIFAEFSRFAVAKN